VAYCYPDIGSVSKIGGAARYIRSDNSKPVFSFVCPFAANIDGGTNGEWPPVLTFPFAIVKTIESGVIDKLHQQGQIVLLTILGNHLPAGWSTLTDEVVQVFTDQVVEAINYFHFDGVDIDDEYSTGDINGTSIFAICKALRANVNFKNKLITKALWKDLQYFPQLAQYLDYGWEMTYGQPYMERLQPYLNAGMAKENLFLGISASDPREDPRAPAAFVMQNGFGGVMVYDVQAVGTDFDTYLTPMVQTEYGSNVKCIVGP